MAPIPADEALQLLREGNRRFVVDALDGMAEDARSRRSELVGGQEPFAVVLGCADSRVPAELVFDQGLGDLFVIRVAGNVVAPSLVGSIEYAAAACGTRLVVVLGHTGCGAVAATLQELENPSADPSPNLATIVDRIRPSVEPLLDGGEPLDRDAVLARAVRANVRASVAALEQESKILRGLVRDGGLRIVGAEYALATGEVEFLDDA